MAIVSTWAPIVVSEGIAGLFFASVAANRAVAYGKTRIQKKRKASKIQLRLAEELRHAVPGHQPEDYETTIELAALLEIDNTKHDTVAQNLQKSLQKIIEKCNHFESLRNKELTASQSQLKYNLLKCYELNLNFNKLITEKEDIHYNSVYYYRELFACRDAITTAKQLKQSMPTHWIDELRPFIKDVGETYDIYFEEYKKLMMNVKK